VNGERAAHTERRISNGESDRDEHEYKHEQEQEQEAKVRGEK
jgi:hypothetical protein